MSISRSVCAVAQQKSAMPRVFSSFDSADDECGACSTSPLTTVPLHEPQAPFLQPYGRPMPWRKAAMQHRFVGFHLKLPAALPERYVESHRSLSSWMCRIRGARRVATGGYNAYTMIATRILRRARVLIVGCGDVGLRCVPLFKAARRRAPRDRAHEPTRARRRTARGGHDAARRRSRRARAASDGLRACRRPCCISRRRRKTGDDDRRTRHCSRHFPRAGAASRAASPVRCRRIAPGAHGFAQASVPHRRTRKRPSKQRILYPTYPMHLSRQPAAGRPSGSSMRARRASTATAAARHRRDTRPCVPTNARAKRRVAGRNALAACDRARRLARVASCGFRGSTPRNRLPLARLEQGTPALVAADDVYTNHIHADDLAAILVRAILRAKPQRVIHASDDTDC